MDKKYILAFESSCDDTSVAVVDMDYNVYSNIISSQAKHKDFGGVVPEIASRLHLKNIVQITDIALTEANVSLEDISYIAVSVNPGLIGALLVGLSYAKGLAYSLGKPLVAVNHMLAHIYANKIEHPKLEPPFLALVVSGGHTEIVHFETANDIEIVGKTKDDASGEAFDKIAKLLDLGYPGGPIVDKLAKGGDKDFVKFPRALNRKGDFDFSYSGLKTSVRTYIEKQSDEFIKENLNHILASAQAAICDILIKKTVEYARLNKINQIIVAGGVSANSYLRENIIKKAKKFKIDVSIPALKYCTDNAAMVAAAAIKKIKEDDFAPLNLNAFSAKGTKFL